jgi:hypothetical protein
MFLLELMNGRQKPWRVSLVMSQFFIADSMSTLCRMSVSDWSNEEDFEAIIILDYPPDDILAVQELVKSRETFVALLTGDLYEVMHYLDPRQGFQFFGYLDRNLYSRVSALVTERTLRQNELADLRWAAAVLAFSQLAKITFDYASSIYELASAKGGAEAGEEINRFRIADNSDPQLFIDFALGRLPKIPKSAFADVPKENKVDPAEFEKRTNEFRLNYIFALKIADLSQRAIRPIDKMIALIDWMRAEFMFGSPALLFANRYFSPNRFRRMIKGFTKRDIKNAAWDLTFVQNWRRAALKGIDTNKPAFLMSGDKAVKDVARRITAESEEEFTNHLREPWGRNSPDGLRIFNHYRQAWETVAQDTSRSKKVPNYPTQLKMIDDLERMVLMSNRE